MTEFGLAFRSITHTDKWTDIHTFYPSDTNREGTTSNVHIHTILFKQVAKKLQDLCRELLDIVTY